MSETTSAAATPTVDLTRFRTVVPRYQWSEIAVRVWGKRSSVHHVPVASSTSRPAAQEATSLTDA